MDKQTEYLDTSIIIGYLKNKNDERRHSSEIINKLKRKHPNVTVIIPQVVLGEGIIKIIEREEEGELVGDSFHKLEKVIKDLEAETPAPTKESLKIASDILEKNNHLKPTDALIVAQALCDPKSTRLFTTDGDLIGNKEIMEREERMREEEKRRGKLQITGEIRKKRRKKKS